MITQIGEVASRNLQGKAPHKTETPSEESAD
jgi:hypothetical protein